MNRYELICVDMFQTLVDVDSRVPYIWRRILGDDFNETLMVNCAKLVGEKVISKFHHQVSETHEFKNLKTTFLPCFSAIAQELSLGFKDEEAVDIFLDEHGRAEMFDDVQAFFQLIGKQIPICLVSDADHVMVLPLLKKFNFDSVFISEQVQSYKNEPESRIFKEVLKKYQIQPDRVIHIGDSTSDIIGAHKFGIKTCWINRNNIKWKHEITPDFVVRSMIEAVDIINKEVDEAI